MKKTITILVMAILSLNLSAQVEERNTIRKVTINVSTFKVNEVIKEGDTTTYAYVSYQNARYTSITDLELIMFSKEKLTELIEGFKYLIPQEKSKSLTYNLSFGSLMNTRYGIYLYSEDDKYTGFSRKRLLKGMAQLEEMITLID